MTHDKLFVDKFIAILIHHKIIKKEEGTAISAGFFASSIDNFLEFLIDEGLITKENVLKALSYYYFVPYFDVTGYFFDHKLLLVFPKDLLLRLEVIPLEQDEQILMVVASEPDNENILPALGEYIPSDIQFRVGLGRDITDAIKEFYDEALTVINDEDLKERQARETYEYLHHEKETTLEEEVERSDRV